jgi:hypothetical protein
MKARCYLAIVRAAESAGVLPFDPDGVFALLWETCVIDDESLRLQALLEEKCKPTSDFLVRPGADRHALLKPLTHTLGFIIVLGEPTPHADGGLAAA